MHFPPFSTATGGRAHAGARGRASGGLANAKVSGQLGQKPQGGRPESGISAMARALGITRKEVERALLIAALAPEAKQAAVEVGLDDNQAALLDAAKEKTPEAQVVSLKARAKKQSARRKATRADADVKKRAAREVASLLVDCVPADAVDRLLAGLHEAGWTDVANAFFHAVLRRRAEERPASTRPEGEGAP